MKCLNWGKYTVLRKTVANFDRRKESHIKQWMAVPCEVKKASGLLLGIG